MVMVTIMASASGTVNPAALMWSMITVEIHHPMLPTTDAVKNRNKRGIFFWMPTRPIMTRTMESKLMVISQAPHLKIFSSKVCGLLKYSPPLDVICNLVVSLVKLVETEQHWMWMFLWMCVDVEENCPPVVEEVGPHRDGTNVDDDGERSKEVGANLQGDKKESLGLVEEVATF